MKHLKVVFSLAMHRVWNYAGSTKRRNLVHGAVTYVDEGSGAGYLTLCCTVCRPMNTYIATIAMGNGLAAARW